MTVKTPKVYAEEWDNLPWRKFQANLDRLQHRIYKAAKNNDKDLIKRLQRLLMGSKCSKYLAVKQVTQLSTGRDTTGIDGIKSLDPKMRIELVDNLLTTENWKPEKLKKVYIPKSNGMKNSCSIPIIHDRVIQCLLKYALEPVYEAIASPGSIGFRTGYSAWNAQKCIFQNLRFISKNNLKNILELGIEKCFDKMNHEKLLSLVTLPPCGIRVLRSALKAGIFLELRNMEVGTAKEGVISPLLANIALHGIEDLHNKKMSGPKYQRGYRYDDNIIYFLKEGECSVELLNTIRKFLEERGLSLKTEKTRLVTATQGFDFLDWHFKVKSQTNTFVSFPSKENRQNLIKRIKSTVKDTRFSLENRISKIKTIFRDWNNYHQYCDKNQVNMWYINKWTHWYLRKVSSYNSKKVTEIIREIFTGYKINANDFTSRLKRK